MLSIPTGRPWQPAHGAGEAADEWSPGGSNIFEADEFGMGSGQFLLQPRHVGRVVGLLLSPH